VKSLVKELVKRVLGRFDVHIVRRPVYESLIERSKLGDDLRRLVALPRGQAPWILDFLEGSRSQLRQDLFTLAELDFKRNGFFVEFGATNGVDLSNTHLMEKEFQWRGILAEPARCWHADLKKNRSCLIDTRCVWKVSGAKLEFCEVDEPELSTIGAFSRADRHWQKRSKRRTYDVETVSLADLLDEHGAPRLIDYLSIDTEGSEYEILKDFDFERYRFNVITCEHNFTANREKLHTLLTRNGYVRKLIGISEFDDWYVTEK